MNTSRYIISVSSLSDALEVFSESGIKPERLYPFISAVGVRASETALRAVRSLPCIERVMCNCRVRASDFSPSPQPAFSAAPLIKRKDSLSPDICVAVIDTGVSEHPDIALFPSRIAAFADFVGGKKTPYDDNGHGTAVAGVLCGSDLLRGGYLVRKHRRLKIAALKSLTADGEGTAFDILTAMQWVYSNRLRYGIRVVNMSLGCPYQGKNDPLCLGAKALYESGVTVVASAGNGALSGEGVLSPAISPFVIAVGGTDNGVRAPFSPESGTKPEVYAPAVDVPTLTADGGYTFVSGTSMAAPSVSADAAEILTEHPDVSHVGLIRRLNDMRKLSL